MKKVFTLLLAGLLTMVMAMSLVGCGSSFSGKYVATKVSIGDIEFEWTAITNNECYITFDDGNFEFELEGNVATGTYTEDENTVTMEIEGASVTATLDGTTLNMTLPVGTVSSSSESGIVFEKE